MRIGIDARLLEKKMTGMGRYLAGILGGIADVDKKNEYILFSLGTPDYPGNGRIKVVPTGAASLKESKWYSPFWQNVVLPRYLHKYKVDLFFSPRSMAPVVAVRPKVVVSIHDVFQKVHKNHHPFIFSRYVNASLPLIINRSSMILTVSNSSRKDIVDYFNVPEEKIKVVYEAAEAKFKPRNLSPAQRIRLKEKYNLPDRFVLYVGVIGFRKNVETIINTAEYLNCIKERNIPFVLIGRASVKHKKIRQMSKRLNGKMVFIDFVEEDDLPLIYNLADVFFFPSLYEGFGLPPLEAMQSGLPVVCSNTSSLPEVVGDAAVMRDPLDYKGFAESILTILDDPQNRRHIRQKGIERAGIFNWKKTAAQITDLFEKVHKAT